VFVVLVVGMVWGWKVVVGWCGVVIIVKPARVTARIWRILELNCECVKMNFSIASLRFIRAIRGVLPGVGKGSAFA
jgi:hypothetical protein